VSTRLGAALAGLGAALLLIGQVSGSALVTHSVAVTLLLAGAILLGYALAIAPRRTMIEPAGDVDTHRVS
jgi:hypothetical protein